MTRINLISQSRRQARAHRVRCRWWATGVVGYSVAALAVCLMIRGSGTFADAVALEDQLAELDVEIQAIQQEQSQIKPVLAEQRLVLMAGRSITDQPDWSLLLTHLADELLGDDVVLSGCTLEPITADDSTKDLQHASMSVTLTGYARSTPAVSRFVLRVEESGLFDRVTLDRTNREPFLDGQAIAFQVRGLMSYGGGASHE